MSGVPPFPAPRPQQRALRRTKGAALRLEEGQEPHLWLLGRLESQSFSALAGEFLGAPLLPGEMQRYCVPTTAARHGPRPLRILRHMPEVSSQT